MFILLSVSLMAMIFFFSSQDAEQSKGLSNGLAAKLLKLFEKTSPAIARFFKTDENIRVLAHFFEYTCLGISYMLLFHELFIGTSRSVKRCVLLSSLAGLAYACSDEIHQIFVPGRSFQLSDIGMDLSGCIIGSAAAAVLIELIKKNGASVNEQ